MKIAVLGLGEAGARYAADLAANGHTVTGYDPVASTAPDGVALAASPGDAVRDAELVLSITPAKFSLGNARDVMPDVPMDAVWADLSSASPATMAEAALHASERGIPFADVAILGPVPLKGASTDLIVSGTGVERLRDVFGPLGADVEIVDGQPGQATSYKLLRSVVMKGFATVVTEAVTAARAAGIDKWIQEQVAGQLTGGQVMVDRYLDGTVAHAERRAHEMEDSLALLQTLDVPSEMTTGTVAVLRRLAAQPR